MDRPPADGLSLWELLWCLGIAGVVLALAVPSFGDLLLDSRRRADLNAFVTAIQLARSEAAKRGEAIVLCKTRDGSTCGGDEIRYDAGWMVFVNTDGARPPHRGPADALLLRYQPASSGPITSNRRFYEFRAFGWRSTNGTVTFCDARGRGRAVIVSYTGRPRVADIGPGGRPLVCGA
ncbi:MAG TPA: GspH/FimT family protein [Gammaproteobacteria bacterium]|nr:GspH/FimT family protein [Gammaproteobacteria bacterium]